MNYKNITCFLALSLLLFSCGENNQTNPGATTDSINAVTDTTSTIPAPISETSCYALTGTDTVKLQFTNNNGVVNGSLYIHRREKDINRGTISGTMNADTLLADYQFMSEGQTSTRQVAFLKKGDQLIEGYGPVDVKGDKTIFKNPSTLTYDEKMPLQKTFCE